MRSTLQVISEGLASRNVSALWIGGMALPAFDVVGQTLDVDCLIADTGEEAMHAVLTEAGYREQERAESFVRYSSADAGLMDVDVMLVDAGTFEKMSAQSRALEVGHTVMRVPCPAHLIALKLHAMKNRRKRAIRDLGDIVELLRNNPGAVQDQDLRAM